MCLRYTVHYSQSDHMGITQSTLMTAEIALEIRKWRRHVSLEKKCETTCHQQSVKTLQPSEEGGVYQFLTYLFESKPF
jgi:hypothetical protein